MSARSDTVIEAPAVSVAPAGAAVRTRPFYWSVRREIWEHRAIYLAPLAVAAFAVLVHVLSLLAGGGGSHTLHAAHPGDPTQPYTALYGSLTTLILVTGLLTGVLYSVGALYGERRDRSILFWKSLPVSDRTAVLAKAAIPLLVLPVIVFAVVVAASLTAAALQTVIWVVKGGDAGALWAQLDLPFVWLGLLYGLPFMMLWYAPVYAWLLLASAWAPRWPFLFGAAPFVLALIVEHGPLMSTRAHWIVERYLGGGVLQPYVRGEGYWTRSLTGLDWIENLAELEPARLYASPVLWIGVLLAALFLVAAAQVRRARAPI
jgi:ABC-2 type transport system permease protein